MRKASLLGCASILLGVAITFAMRSGSSKEIGVHETTPPTVVSLNVAPDRQLILAGFLYAENSAWAESIDERGRVRWRLTIPSESASPAFSPMFSSAAVLPGGNLTLCGKIGVDKFTPTRGVVDFIDKNGRQLRSNHILPNQGTQVRVAEVLTCVAMPEGIVAIGKTVAINSAKLSGLEEFYWVTYWDSNGQLLKERSFPTQLSQVDSIGTPQVEPDGHVVFCGRGGTQSELLVLDKDGVLTTRTALPAEYLLVRSIVPATVLQIISADYRKPWEVITLDLSLRFVRRDSSATILNMNLSDVVSDENGTIFAFGQRTKNGVPVSASVATASADVKSIKEIDVPSIERSGTVSSVAYDKYAKAFILAHTSVRQDRATTELTYLLKAK
jgi:hypothetical protein